MTFIIVRLVIAYLKEDADAQRTPEPPAALAHAHVISAESVGTHRLETMYFYLSTPL